MSSVEVDVAFEPDTATARLVASRGTRGRRQHPLAQIRSPLSIRWRLGLGVAGMLSLVLVWLITSSMTNLVPTPVETWHAFTRLWRDGVFIRDVRASSQRIAIGYGISVALGIVLGIAIGTFTSAEAFFEPQFGFLRYIPASALIPVMLLWLGIGESPKITMIVIGTVFFNILMIADVARLVPRELLNASYTLGASRSTVLRRVVFRHSLPGIVDVARVNLAAAWLMLVVSEVLAANEGLAYRIVRAQRFRGFDTMFAVLIAFGIIGLMSDLFLRWLRNAVAPWAKP
ncbi:MAG TPA: ABC transporter permease [Acidimicrobiales bacterium]|nr:ABC transporter permease [Acidimicrobiales bacterium]